MLISDLYRALDARFPFDAATSWDPVGLQLGSMSDAVERVAVCHEVTDTVVEELSGSDATVLITYHPLLFEPVTAIVGEPSTSDRALRLLRSGHSLIVVHTAMDVASGGSSDALAEALGLTVTGAFGTGEDEADEPIGRFGNLGDLTTLGAFAGEVSERLAVTCRLAGDPERAIERVAVVPGSGASFIPDAARIADVLVTGDVSHHRAQEARRLGLSVVDAGHVPTERPGINRLYDSVVDIAPEATLLTSDPHPWEDVPWKT